MGNSCETCMPVLERMEVCKMRQEGDRLGIWILKVTDQGLVHSSPDMFRREGKACAQWLTVQLRVNSSDFSKLSPFSLWVTEFRLYKNIYYLLYIKVEAQVVMKDFVFFISTSKLSLSQPHPQLHQRCSLLCSSWEAHERVHCASFQAFCEK